MMIPETRFIHKKDIGAASNLFGKFGIIFHDYLFLWVEGS